MTRRDDNDVLEQNVSTLLESGGEPPKLSDAARTRIRDALVAKHGAVRPAKARWRVPVLALGFGLAAAAATALVVASRTGGDANSERTGALADGTTYLVRGDAKVTVLGPRRVRVEGEVLLDVAPGKGTFVVETATGHIEVLGTRFVVAAEAQRTFTAVVRGEVKLATPHGAVVVHAGEQAIAEPGRAPVRGPAPRLSHLVSWAKSARHREEGGVEPMRHGALYARDPGVRGDGQLGEEYPLPLRQLTLDVVVEDQVARVALDQTFHNPHPRVLEGLYKFAIPPDAALQRLAMYVDGKLTESAVVERMQARRIYEELVYRRIDPALLEYAGTGRLNLRVYPLFAQQDKRLVLAYTQSLPKLYDAWTLAIPLPEVDGPVGEVVVSARIKGCASCELSSPSHAIEVERSGEDAIVKYRRASEKIGDSFVVHVRDARANTTVATFADAKDRYLLVRAPVELGSAPREYRPRTWVILDDVSASRSPLELKAQADLVDAFLRELDEQDRVALVAFDVEAREKLPPTRVIDVDRRAVRQLLKHEGGVGATDFQVALDAALKLLADTPPDDARIVYIGDGVITSGPRQLDKLRARIAGKAQFIGVGVGDGPDTQTLDALAAATGGYSTTIDLSDDLRWRAFDLIAALHTSRVTGVTARLVDAAGNLVPATAYLRSAQLADGEQLQLVAKLAGDGTPVAVELAGTRAGATWTQKIALASPTDGAGYLPRLWAQQHIAARLLAKHEPVIVPPCTDARTTACPSETELRAQRDEEIRKEVVALGKQYFLLSRHTSLLVLENDAMYAKYGVRKGSGNTWAPYELPATIPVVKVAQVGPLPSDVVDDAELVREPLQILSVASDDADWDDVEDNWVATRWPSVGAGRFGREAGGIGWGTGAGFGAGGGSLGARGEGFAEPTRATLGLLPAVPRLDDVELVHGLDREADAGPMVLDSVAVPVGRAVAAKRKRSSVAAAELRAEGRVTMRPARTRTAGIRYPASAPTPRQLTSPTEHAFDDVTAFVPALVPDVADEWRGELRMAAGARGTPSIDEAARRLLETARDRLATGVYRWADREIAIDRARRFAWRRITDTGLEELAVFDGKAFVRRYPELGLAATRAAEDDAVALSLAYLPIWIAEPAQYARWFDVALRGPREVSLSIRAGGKAQVVLVLVFDAQHRLVAIRDGDGKTRLEVTWDAAGPVSARVGDRAIAVGFTPDSITDATAVYGAPGSLVLVELPTRVPQYWRTRIEREPAGSPAWRHAQRQWMASAAAVADRQTLVRAYDELRRHGGVELGDLALASGGLASTTTDLELAEALSPAAIAHTPLARYLAAGRAYRKARRADRLTPATDHGLVGALWSLRALEAQLAAGDAKAALDTLEAMGDRALTLRLVGAWLVGQRWDATPEQTVRAWQAVAVGDYKNVALAAAAQFLARRGHAEIAADVYAKLVSELDLDALPPQLTIAPYQMTSSRRGVAGFQLLYATWRDRVLAGTSLSHVLALLPQAARHPSDLVRLLARAEELAAGDPDRTLAVARAGKRYDQPAFAQRLLEPLLARSPTREVYQLAAWLAQSQGRHADALAYLEKAQEVAADEAVDLATVRGELREILQLARLVALGSTGAARDQAVERALEWARRWRLVDPQNTEIDRLLGDFMIAIGDHAGAWRQLSSMIERDPWSSAGYVAVAEAFEQQGRVADALPLWQQAIVIDQTNPTPRLRKAQALLALGQTAEGEALLEQVATGKWHDMWATVVYRAKRLLEQGKQPRR